MEGPGDEKTTESGQPHRKGTIRGRMLTLEASYDGYRGRRAKVRRPSRCKCGPGNSRLTPVAIWTAGRVIDPSKLQGQLSSLGGLTSVQAVTRVKSEKASKTTMRAPSLPDMGEG